MNNEVKIYKALADKNRIRIIKMLESRELCVCEIKDILNLANSTVSKHLSILREVDLITDRKDGKWVYFQLNDDSYHPTISTILNHLKNHLNTEIEILNDRINISNLNTNLTCKNF